MKYVIVIEEIILYGEKDHLTSQETISGFTKRVSASLKIMKEGEHWFHIPQQIAFLDNWVKDMLYKV